MNKPIKKLFSLFSLLLIMTGHTVSAADISDFFGAYTGSASVESNGTTTLRDMNVLIEKSKKGFKITWKSVTHKADGRLKEKEYIIGFVPSPRDNIYTSTMKTNVFGKPEPLDPLKGDPYVWSRLTGDTLTVFSLQIDEEGGYEVQAYNRTLAEGGLDLEYRRIRNGIPLKTIDAFLARQ